MAVTVDGSGHPAGSMRIGQVARRSGFTVKALRFYEAMGLLPPSSRSAGGDRLYDEADLHRLEFIRQAKTLGLALDEIRELVVSARSQCGGTTRARLGRLLAERIVQTTRQIETLTQLRRELERRRRLLARRSTGLRGYCLCLHDRERPGSNGPAATTGAVAGRAALPRRPGR